MNKNYQIPFDDKGNLKHYPESWGGLHWKDNYEFEATLTYREMCRGRSAAFLVFADGAGMEYPMFLKDFDEAIRVKNILKGSIGGRWTFCKRGCNYGLRMAELDGEKGESEG